MPIFWTACVITLPVLGLGYYTVHKMQPGSFRVQTSVWRLFSFRLEIESTGMTQEQRSAATLRAPQTPRRPDGAAPHNDRRA